MRGDDGLARPRATPLSWWGTGVRLLLLCAALIVWGLVRPPLVPVTPRPVVPSVAGENESAQPPVQAYYHRAFFSEPWRTPIESAKTMTMQAAAVLAVTIMLDFLLRLVRWKREGRGV